MKKAAIVALVLVALVLVGPPGVVAFEPPGSPPKVVGKGRSAGIFVTSHETKSGGSAKAVSAPLQPVNPAASGTVQYVDIPTIVVIYTKYYHTPDCHMELSPAEVAHLQEEVEKTRKFNWRSSHMKCNMKIDYLIIGDDPGERTLTPDMMWSWVENGYWLPFWSCDGGATSVEQDLYDAGIVDGQYAVVMVLYAFQNCDTAWSPIGGGTYGPDMGCMGDAAYIGNPMAWGLDAESVCTHEYLHALDAIYQESGNPLGSDPHSADQPATFPYPKDCGLHFNFLINNVLDPASWLLLYPQWAVVQTVLDSDDDGVPDAGDLPMTELTMGTSANDADSDDDGLSDLGEAMATYYSESDPLDPDSDGDGVRDGADPFPLYYCNEYVGEGAPAVNSLIAPGEYTEISRFNQGDPDYGVIVYARWTDGVLYIAADVTDDMVEYPWDEPWWCDNFEIQIDAQQDGWFVGGNPNYRFLIVPRGVGHVPFVRGDNYYDDPGNDAWHEIDVSGITARYSTYSGGYTIELAIPESVMPGVTIERDATLRMTFFMLDYDTYPGWPRYNIMTKQLDDIPGFVYLHLSEHHYYVDALTGDDGYDGEAAEWDGVHGPKQTIQAMVDAAVAPAVVHVARGTYAGPVAMASEVSVVGAGASCVTITTPGTGPAVDFQDVADGHIEGVTFVSGSGSGNVGVRSHRSTITVNDCVFTGGRNGVGIDYTGEAVVTNCLLADNAGCGVWVGATARVELVNCTVVNSGTYGMYVGGSNNVTLLDTIFWGNADDLSISGSATMSVSYCDIGDGDFAGSSGNISDDAEFVAGPLHNYYLSQTAAGQASTSPCVDTGSTTASAAGLDALTTRTDGASDAGQVDMGYHASYGFQITDVYWDQASTSVVLKFSSLSGEDYTVEAVDADAYADGLSWSTLTTTAAAGPETTVTDNLTTDPLGAAYRFYRVRHDGTGACSRQTAAVFELSLPAIPSVKFVGCPLVPDPDHASVREIFGEKTGGADGRQIPRSGFQISDLNEATGAVSRMRYVASGADMTFSVLAGTEFNVEAGVGYEVVMGIGPSATYPLRLTGYVPETALALPMTKTGAQSLRWMAYGMPRPMGLADLGIEGAVVPWNALNRVRLLFPGSTAWSNYQYDSLGGFWYAVGAPGVPANPTIQCGMGIVFIRGGPADSDDVLVLPTWYTAPPNL